jgi:hypothetical protein
MAFVKRGARGALLCLALTFTHRPALAIAEKPTTATGLKPCDVDSLTYDIYGGCPDIGFVIGTVTAIDLAPSGHYSSGKLEEGPGNPLIRLAVQLASPEPVGKDVVIDLALNSGGIGLYGSYKLVTQIEVKVGGRVLVTVFKEKPARKWSCGKLRPCDQELKEHLWGVGVYLSTRWP